MEVGSVLYCLFVYLQRMPSYASWNVRHPEVTYAAANTNAEVEPGTGGRLPIIAPENGLVSALKQSHKISQQATLGKSKIMVGKSDSTRFKW